MGNELILIVDVFSLFGSYSNISIALNLAKYSCPIPKLVFKGYLAFISQINLQKWHFLMHVLMAMPKIKTNVPSSILFNLIDICSIVNHCTTFSFLEHCVLEDLFLFGCILLMSLLLL